MRITKNFQLCLSCFTSKPLLSFLCDNGQLATKFWVRTFVYEKQFMKLPCKLDFKIFPRDIILQMTCWLEEFLMYLSSWKGWRWKLIHHGAGMEDTISTPASRMTFRWQWYIIFNGQFDVPQKWPLFSTCQPEEVRVSSLGVHCLWVSVTFPDTIEMNYRLSWSLGMEEELSQWCMWLPWQQESLDSVCSTQVRRWPVFVTPVLRWHGLWPPHSHPLHLWIRPPPRAYQERIKALSLCVSIFRLAGWVMKYQFL